MQRRLGLGLVAAAFCLSFAPLLAQRPADAVKTAPSGKPPDSVFLEDLTWAEVRDLVKAGWTTAIIGTAGTEQKGPHMVDGEHKFVMEYAADKVARRTRQDARRAGHHVRAGGQLGESRRPHGQARHDYAAARIGSSSC